MLLQKICRSTSVSIYFSCNITKCTENIFFITEYRTQQAYVLQAAPQSSRVLLLAIFAFDAFEIKITWWKECVQHRSKNNKNHLMNN